MPSVKNNLCPHSMSPYFFEFLGLSVLYILKRQASIDVIIKFYNINLLNDKMNNIIHYISKRSQAQYASRVNKLKPKTIT